MQVSAASWDFSALFQMKCRPLITQFPLLVHLHYFLIHRMSAKGTSLDHIPPYSKCQRLLKYNSLSFCSNKLSINIRFLVLGPAGEGCVFWTKSPYSVIFERFPGTMREFFTQCFAPCAFFSWVTNHKNKNFAGATSSDTGKKKKEVVRLRWERAACLRWNTTGGWR